MASQKSDPETPSAACAWQPQVLEVRFAQTVRSGCRDDIEAAARAMRSAASAQPAHDLILALTLVSYGCDRPHEASRLLCEFVQQTSEDDAKVAQKRAFYLARLGVTAALQSRGLRADEVAEWLLGGNRLHEHVHQKLRLVFADFGVLQRRKASLQRSHDLIAASCAEHQSAHDAFEREHLRCVGRQRLAGSRAEESNWRRKAARARQQMGRSLQRITSKQRSVVSYREKLDENHRAHERMIALKL